VTLDLSYSDNYSVHFAVLDFSNPQRTCTHASWKAWIVTGSSLAPPIHQLRTQPATYQFGPWRRRTVSEPPGTDWQLPLHHMVEDRRAYAGICLPGSASLYGFRLYRRRATPSHAAHEI
jgi:hypothetical protein